MMQNRVAKYQYNDYRQDQFQQIGNRMHGKARISKKTNIKLWILSSICFSLSHGRYTVHERLYTKKFPDADIEQKLRDMNQSEEIIEQFFSTYPELRKQSPQTCIYDGSWFAFLCIFF